MTKELLSHIETLTIFLHIIHASRGWFRKKCERFWMWYDISLWNQNVYVSMCLIVSGLRDLFESAVVTPLDFSLWGWMKNEAYKRRVDTPDELLAAIFWRCWTHKERRRSTHSKDTRSSHTHARTHTHVHTRVAKCVGVDGEIFENLFCSVTVFFSFLCNNVAI